MESLGVIVETTPIVGIVFLAVMPSIAAFVLARSKRRIEVPNPIAPNVPQAKNPSRWQRWNPLPWIKHNMAAFMIFGSVITLSIVIYYCSNRALKESQQHVTMSSPHISPSPKTTETLRTYKLIPGIPQDVVGPNGTTGYQFQSCTGNVHAYTDAGAVYDLTPACLPGGLGNGFDNVRVHVVSEKPVTVVFKFFGFYAN